MPAHINKLLLGVGFFVPTATPNLVPVMFLAQFGGLTSWLDRRVTEVLDYIELASLVSDIKPRSWYFGPPGTKPADFVSWFETWFHDDSP